MEACTDLLSDVGEQCFDMSDNCPADWAIFRSKSCPERRFVLTGDVWKVFPTEKAMEDAMDALIENWTEDDSPLTQIPEPLKDDNWLRSFDTNDNIKSGLQGVECPEDDCLDPVVMKYVSALFD